MQNGTISYDISFVKRESVERTLAVADDLRWFSRHPHRAWRARRAWPHERGDYHPWAGAVHRVIPRDEILHVGFTFRFQGPFDFPCDDVTDQWCRGIAATAFAKGHTPDRKPVQITN
jgi:hypothetical protein